MPTNNHEAPLAYRIPDFCGKLGISRSTLWKLVKLRKVQVIRVGRRTLIPHSEAIRLSTEGA